MKKNTFGWSAIALLVIIVAAIFVRTYKFDEYLYFKMDQSRDAILLTKAVENGPGYLPLLGARAGAVELESGFLRLGPIDYYFQYLSGVIFRSTEPYVYAYPDLLFSILAIVLLYFFARLYFSKKNSLLIAAMYAFSFIIIEYSRFAWNPNSLQFFLLLSFYGLLRFLNENDVKKRKWWLVMWSIGITIGSQLHFFGFFSLLGISGLMTLFHYQVWKKQNVAVCFTKGVLLDIAKYSGMALLVFAIFYTPVIISDVYKKGENTKNFFEAIGSKPANKPLGEKIAKSVTGNLKYYCLITTSECYGSKLNNNRLAIGVTLLVLVSGLSVIVRNLRKKTLTSGQKDFLMLLVIWTGVFTVLTIPVSFQLRPRFFIVVFAVPFIFLGLLFEYLDERLKKRHAVALSLLLAFGIIAWNMHGTYAWFKEQSASQKKATIVKRTLILKTKDGVTLGQLQGVTDWMVGRLKQNSNLYYYVKPEHVRPIDFLLSQAKQSIFKFATISLNGDPNAQFFAVIPTKKGIESVQEKYKSEVKVIDSKQYGQLTVYEIDFPGRAISDSFVFKSGKQDEDRIYWKDVFNLNKK